MREYGSSNLARGRGLAWCLTLLAVGVLAAGLGGCRGRSEGLPLDVFGMSVGADPESFDPGVVTGSVEGMILWQLFEGLYSPSLGDGPPVPGAAERHEVSEDQLSWTFHLRRDGRWSNGDPVTAHDFEYAWKRILRGDVAAYYVSFLRYLRNGRAFETGEATEDEVGVRALDDWTLQVELQKPIPFFLEVVSFFTLFPVHRASIEEHGQENAFRAENLVTNGAWAMDRYLRRNRIEAVPNPYWWGHDNLRLNRLIIRIIEDHAARVQAYRDGRVDWVYDLPANELATLRMDPAFRTADWLGTYYYRFNTTRPPFDDVRVRRAFSLAVNREELCRCTLDDLYTPATSFVPPMPGYERLDVIRYDGDEARRLLAEAGYPNGEGIPRLRLLYNTDENHRLIAQAIQDMWQMELGVQIQLVNQEWKVYLDSTREMDFDVGRAGWIGDYSDPNTFLEMWKTGDANNNTGWGSPTFDRMIEEGFNISDPEERLRHLLEAERYLLEARPIMPIYYYGQFHLVRPNVRGWEMSTTNTHIVHRVYKVDEEESP
ncbi:MAG: peptide ABC transporter substrate-binding protein [Deltaproteobacteria bacterium]|nr:MAG: peptide ABC transporter substrate-binding protein [Deltaproteobacteria bacterium]